MLTEDTGLLSLRRDYPVALALFVAGLLVNLMFSRMGFMPLDASIVFDGGWRILSGQVPWRDFVAPYGVVPAVMQACFFALMGTNWLAYCLHASVVNGCFAVVLYTMLVVLRLPGPLAFFYSLCAVFFFYPPVGLPYMEQHSFFFTLAALACALAGNQSDGERLQRALWGAVPLLAALAFLSKQVPFAFAAVGLPLVLVLPGRSRLRVRLAGVACGAVACVGLGLLVGLVLGVEWPTVVEYLFVRPGTMGQERAGAMLELLARLANRYDNLPGALGLEFAANAIFLYRLSVLAFPAMLVVWLVARRRPPDVSADFSRLCSALLLAPVTYATSMLLGFVSNNQTQNSVAFYPVAAGLVHAAVCAEIRIARTGLALGGHWMAGREHSGRRLTRLGTRIGRWLAPEGDTGSEGRRPSLPAALTLIALVGVSVSPVRHWTFDTVTWANTVDMTRMVNDMTFDPALAARSEDLLPRGMEFVRWTPSPANYDLDGWTDLTTFLRDRNRNFLIIGDTLVTYGLVGKPSIAPNLWFHPGLAMPATSEPAFERYELALLATIAARDVRYIVIEGERTRMGFGLQQLPRLREWMANSWCETHTFGQNRVFEPCR